MLLNIHDLGLTAEELERAQHQGNTSWLIEAAQCAWEHCLKCDFRRESPIVDMMDDGGYGTLRTFCSDISHHLAVGWEILTDSTKDKLGSFEWGFVPLFMEECVTWDDGPTLNPNWIQILRDKNPRKRLYLANVQLLFPADNESEAADAVSGMLTDTLEGKGMIHDWGYLPLPNGSFAHPTEVRYPDPLPEGPIYLSDLIFVKSNN